MSIAILFTLLINYDLNYYQLLIEFNNCNTIFTIFIGHLIYECYYADFINTSNLLYGISTSVRLNSLTISSLIDQYAAQ